MLADRFPPTGFTHQSNNLTACPLSRTASWLVWQCSMLIHYCFKFPSKQTQTNQVTCRLTSKVTKVVQSLQSLCLYSGCSSLSRASEPDIPRKTVTTAFEVICGWSVAGTVFYIIITTRHHRSVRHLLVTDIPQLDQLTWCTSGT